MGMKKTLVWLLALVLVSALGFIGYVYIKTVPVPLVKEEVVATPATYEWCVDRGGETSSYGPNSLKWCVYESRVYTERCLVNGDYLVQAKNTLNLASTTILVKYKKSPGEKLLCEYRVGPNDYVIQDEAIYLMGLVGRYVVVDRGTGPSGRDLILYDALYRRRAYIDGYSRPISVSEEGIIYWQPTTEKATKANCPEFDLLKSYGGTVVIERHVRLNPVDLSLTDLGEKRCQYSS
jgi:hypothetical protein